MLCKCDVTIYSVVCGILLMAIELGASEFVPTQGYGSGHNRCYGCYGWLLITPHNTS